MVTRLGTGEWKCLPLGRIRACSAAVDIDLRKFKKRTIEERIIEVDSRVIL
jgi:hypothetical protein